MNDRVRLGYRVSLGALVLAAATASPAADVRAGTINPRLEGFFLVPIVECNEDRMESDWATLSLLGDPTAVSHPCKLECFAADTFF